MVYVDDYGEAYSTMKMSHLTADTNEELDTFALKLSLKPEWKQYGSITHFDVSVSKRKKAIELGAMAVTPRDLVMLMSSNTEMCLRAKIRAQRKS